MTKKHILIVDDELMILYSLQYVLKNTYDVTVAQGGKKAIDLIDKSEKPYDLIISDVSMPDVNGVNLYLYIEKHYPGLEKRVIFMTGGPTSVYLDDFFVNTTAVCLTKPFEFDALRKVIDECIASNEKES
tara:strand:+ start:1110 stop:1499 length:390 start_codon:yes stop_codon:yes gene_type:complete